MTRVLAVCGSLRAASSNGALLDAAARLAPAGARIERFDGIGALPPFNPDLDAPIQAGDCLIAIGGADHLDKLEALAGVSS